MPLKRVRARVEAEDAIAGASLMRHDLDRRRHELERARAEQQLAGGGDLQETECGGLVDVALDRRTERRQPGSGQSESPG